LLEIIHFSRILNAGMVCLFALFAAELPSMRLFFAHTESGIMRSLVKIEILL